MRNLTLGAPATPDRARCDRAKPHILWLRHVMRFVYRRLYDALAMGGGYLRFQPPQVRRLPIPTCDLSKPFDKELHNDIVAKVEAMLEAKERLAGSKTDKDKAYYENKCALIDRHVYDLYGLTEKDIATELCISECVLILWG
jgi:hypothetical protein